MVNLAEERDIAQIAEIHSMAFPRQKDSLTWVKSTLSAYPRYMCYVVRKREEVCGYIFWAQKSGFREAVVLELDQVAVSQKFQGQGYGKSLITQSLAQVQEHMSKNAQYVKNILVSTRTDNTAQKLYQSALGATVQVVIPNLYSADEVIMVANVST